MADQTAEAKKGERELLSQGAEARVYVVDEWYNGQRCVAKERFPKAFRHPVLDARLRNGRMKHEVRCLTKCGKFGIDAPTVYVCDYHNAVIYMEKIEGQTLRDTLRQSDLSDAAQLKEALPLARQLGELVAQLHDKDLVHGDLTTSNVMVRDESKSLAVIDFGLGFVSTTVEDKGVDLYVLERAFLSTHPNSEAFFEAVLNGYHNGKNSKVLTKLEQVRRRGRKKDMSG